MLEVYLTEEQKKFKREVQDFVKSVPRQLILDMDADKIKFPDEFVREAGKRNLMGIRFPRKYGGRDLKWVDEILYIGEITADVTETQMKTITNQVPQQVTKEVPIQVRVSLVQLIFGKY